MQAVIAHKWTVQVKLNPTRLSTCAKGKSPAAPGHNGLPAAPDTSSTGKGGAKTWELDSQNTRKLTVVSFIPFFQQLSCIGLLGITLPWICQGCISQVGAWLPGILRGWITPPMHLELQKAWAVWVLAVPQDLLNKKGDWRVCGRILDDWHVDCLCLCHKKMSADSRGHRRVKIA